MALSKKVNDAFDFGASFMQGNNRSVMPKPQEIQAPASNGGPLEYLKMRLVKGEIDLRNYKMIAAQIQPKMETNYIG